MKNLNIFVHFVKIKPLLSILDVVDADDLILGLLYHDILNPSNYNYLFFHL